MIWLSWRQQRTEAILAAALLAGLAAVLIPNGVSMSNAYDDLHLSSCLVKHPHSCMEAISLFNARFDGLYGVFLWFNFVPGLLGALLAAPFILDLEHGTYKLAWTQSVTRRRWIAVKLTTAVACAAVASAVASGLVTWWRGPLDGLNGRMDIGVFDFEGIVPYAYTAFALALTLTVGAVSRRIVPSILAGLVGYAVVRIFVQNWLRERLVHPLSATWPANAKGPALQRAWVLLDQPSDRAGHLLPAHGLPVLESCGAGVSRAKAFDCLARNGFYRHAIWQPAEHFWTLQVIEFGIFAALTAGLLAFAVVWTRRRTA